MRNQLIYVHINAYILNIWMRVRFPSLIYTSIHSKKYSFLILQIIFNDFLVIKKFFRFIMIIYLEKKCFWIIKVILFFKLKKKFWENTYSSVYAKLRSPLCNVSWTGRVPHNPLSSPGQDPLGHFIGCARGYVVSIFPIELLTCL